MKYTKLGNSDLRVSRICMGCMGFGDPGRGQHSWTLDEAHSREIIKKGATSQGPVSNTSERPSKILLPNGMILLLPPNFYPAHKKKSQMASPVNSTLKTC